MREEADRRRASTTCDGRRREPLGMVVVWHVPDAGMVFAEEPRVVAGSHVRGVATERERAGAHPRE